MTAKIIENGGRIDRYEILVALELGGGYDSKSSFLVSSCGCLLYPCPSYTYHILVRYFLYPPHG